MSRINSFVNSRIAAAVAGLLVTAPVLADDTEIFRSQAASTGAQPNVLFVMDTSGSMASLVATERPPYNPAKDYSSEIATPCNSSNIYFVAAASAAAKPPKCSGSGAASSFPASSNECLALKNALAGGAAYYQDVAAQFVGSSTKRWNKLTSGNSGLVECQTDNGVHGQSSNNPTTIKYIQENTTAPWTNTVGNAWGQAGGSGASAYNTSTSYVFYSANYLNWANMPAASFSQSRLEIIQEVATNLANSLNNVNIGLMRYNPDQGGNAEGGSIIQAVDNISTNRSAFISSVASLSANGHTPLSETLYEAEQYFGGRAVVYGNTNPKSVAAARTGGQSSSNVYASPIKYQCQKNYIVFLTDGLPTTDTSANTAARVGAMPGFRYLGDQTPPGDNTATSCGTPPGSSADGGQCMDDVANYMNTIDQSSAMDGPQNVQTYTIGFGDDPDLATTGTPYLDRVALAGGTGASRTAADADSLTATLQQIFSDIQQTSATFVTPAVSVNAFNRAQTQGDLYFSVFKASLGLHWPGNLKKYKLKSGSTISIIDSKGMPAVDANGFFANGTTSFWSATSDGADVTRGGALSNIPVPTARKIFSNLSATKDLTATSNVFSTANSAITDALLGTGGSKPSKSTIVDFVLGYDVDDVNNDGSKTDPGPQVMGDPLHGKPGIVTYGGTPSSPDATDTVVYVPTNDGLLHAIAAKDGSGGGAELWAFAPKELLYRFVDLYDNPDTSVRTYGLDGDIEVLKYDKNNDGVVDTGDGDFVWLFFGMRMGRDSAGTSYYYGLDVTDRNTPKLLWADGVAQLPGLGQTWSPPTVTRVMVGANGADNTNSKKLVLIFGGGYDAAAETATNRSEANGNRIFMVDAETGALLWSAGPSGANLNLSTMTNAIPGRITVVDTDGDQLADRMYAADLGGRVWRFDIFNGNSASTLVTGNIFAKLGAGSVTPAVTQNDNRRFYNAPDVSLVQSRGVAPYFNLAIGSGYRGHPLDTSTTDRFYSLRDKQPYSHLAQTTYASMTPILDGDLTDITANPGTTAVPLTQPGWKLSMTRNGNGEKILSEATTVNNTILFTTFQPKTPAAGDPCYPTSQNRAYAVTVFAGKPALDFNDDGVVNTSDLSTPLGQSGIAGEVNVAFLRDGSNDPSNPSSPLNPKPICMAGPEVFKKCISAGGTVRTFWRRGDAQ